MRLRLHHPATRWRCAPAAARVEAWTSERQHLEAPIRRALTEQLMRRCDLIGRKPDALEGVAAEDAGWFRWGGAWPGFVPTLTPPPERRPACSRPSWNRFWFWLLLLSASHRQANLRCKQTCLAPPSSSRSEESGFLVGHAPSPAVARRPASSHVSAEAELAQFPKPPQGSDISPFSHKHQRDLPRANAAWRS